jgi:MFS family permease
MYGTLLAVPVVLAGRPGWSAADAGLALAMMSVAMIAIAPFGGRVADRRGHRLPAVSGFTLLTVGAAMLAAMGGKPSAFGLASAAVQTAAIEAVDPRHAGIASGLFSTGRYAGSIVAALLLALLLGEGGVHAGAFFAVTAAAAAGSALFALRLGASGRALPAAETS